MKTFIDSELKEPIKYNSLIIFENPDILYDFEKHQFLGFERGCDIYLSTKDLDFKSYFSDEKRTIMIRDYLCYYCNKDDILITRTLLNFSNNFYEAVLTAKLLYEQGTIVICLQNNFNTKNLKSLILFETNFLETVSSFFEHKKENEKLKKYLGFQKAKANGKRLKNIELTVDDFPKFSNLYQIYYLGVITKKQFANELGISRPTLDKLIKQYQSKIT